MTFFERVWRWLRSRPKLRWTLGAVLALSLAITVGRLGLHIVFFPPEAHDRAGRESLRRTTQPLGIGRNVRVERIHSQQYRHGELLWQLWASVATVEPVRYVFGTFRHEARLRVWRPAAEFRVGQSTIRIRADAGFHSIKTGQWEFRSGRLRSGRKSERFERLYWDPVQLKISWDNVRIPHPMLRFWEPLR